jgi:hypothetical protein
MSDCLTGPEKADILATVEEIRRQIRLRRSAQPEAGADKEEAGDRLELARSLEEVRAHQGVSAHWPIVWRTPAQALFAFLQRLLRLLLRWYINPIVDQQNAFNAATERTLHLLVTAHSRLQDEVSSLRRQIQALEERIGQEGSNHAP